MKKAFDGKEDFLEWFKEKGYFLDDLILEPVNKMEGGTRRRLRFESIPGLAKRISLYRPTNVVALMKAIEPMVKDAVDKAGLTNCRFYATHFPGCGQQNLFMLDIADIISKLQN
jgi:hypothetical protein